MCVLSIFSLPPRRHRGGTRAPRSLRTISNNIISPYWYDLVFSRNVLVLLVVVVVVELVAAVVVAVVVGV